MARMVFAAHRANHGRAPRERQRLPESGRIAVRPQGCVGMVVVMSSATSPVENAPIHRDHRSGDHEKLITVISEH